MAEILLSLTIIGVVAAITLPSLTGNINERTWNTQRKALYARFSQALALMPSLNGYGKYSGTNTEGVVTTTEDTAAETFVTNGLSKVMKINNICAANQLSDCGIPTSYTNMVNSKKTFPTKLSELNSMFTSGFSETDVNGDHWYQNPQKDIDTKAVAFETGNGESIAVYYNPNCIGKLSESNWHYAQPKMCVNFIYDLNNAKGPNTVGKDIGFITALYPSDPVIVAPIPLSSNASDITGTNREQYNAGKICTAQDPESRVPSIEELGALFYNRELVGIESGNYWSSTIDSPGEDGIGWYQGFRTGYRIQARRSGSLNIRCIKR